MKEALLSEGVSACLLDGDELRSGVNRDLGFSDEDRAENIRRAAHLAQLLAGQQLTVIAAFVTPKEVQRELVRSIIPPEKLCLVHIDCPVEICVARDVKGLYAKALTNQMELMTGVQSTFEVPAFADMTIPTSEMSIPAALQKLLEARRQRFRNENQT